jgi:hypothetical protein
MLWASPAWTQDPASPPQGTSRGENFSAKPPAQLFATDCTGSGCHKSPQGLGRNASFGGLAGFLREHYTNSRESAAALANYLAKLPRGPEPREARTPRSGKPVAAAPASGGPGWLDPTTSDGKPVSNEAHPSRQAPAGQNTSAPSGTGRASRAAVKPDEEPPAGGHQQPPAAEPADGSKPEAPSKPGARAQRGRQPATAAVAQPPPPAPTPAAPEAAPAPPPPPQPKQYDIFD